MLCSIYQTRSKSIEVNKTKQELLFYTEFKFNGDFDIENPIIEIEKPNGVAMLPPNSYNYVGISEDGDDYMFYYITKREMVNGTRLRLYLKKDVLTTYKDIIMAQKGLVLRAQASNISSLQELVDDRLPLNDFYTLVNEPIDTTHKNLEFIDDNYTSIGDKNIVLSTIGADFLLSSMSVYFYPQNIHTPTGTNLDEINVEGRINTNVMVCTCNRDDFNGVTKYLEEHSNLATNLISAYMCPFKVQVHPDLYSNYLPLGAGNTYVRLDSDGTTPISKFRMPTYREYSDYLILGEFTLSSKHNNDSSLRFLDKEPYCYTEVYLPYYGWYQIDRTKYLGDVIMVYYTCNFITGESSVYVYDKTKNSLLFIAPVQLLVPFVRSTTNKEQVDNNRNAIITNTAIGVIGGTLGAVGGVVSGNPLVAIGGAVALGGAIAKSVNANNQNLPTSQHSEHSNITSLYTDRQLQVRTFYRDLRNGYTTDYLKENGKPLNVYTALSNVGGYCEIKCHIPLYGSSLTMTLDESKELEDILLKGVILPSLNN